MKAQGLLCVGNQETPADTNGQSTQGKEMLFFGRVTGGERKAGSVGERFSEKLEGASAPSKLGLKAPFRLLVSLCPTCTARKLHLFFPKAHGYFAVTSVDALIKCSLKYHQCISSNALPSRGTGALFPSTRTLCSFIVVLLSLDDHKRPIVLTS